MNKVKHTEAMSRTATLFSLGINLHRRSMIIGVPYMEHNVDNDVSFPMAVNFFAGLQSLEEEYVPEDASNPKKHIDIQFLSYGGDVYTSFGIYDRMIQCSVPIHMHVYGACFSGGSLILQAADKRYISNNSRLMLHYGFTSDEGTSDPERLEEYLREHKATMERLVDIYHSRGKATKLTKRKIRDILRIETYLDAKKCIEYGLADEIIEPKEPKIV